MFTNGHEAERVTVDDKSTGFLGVIWTVATWLMIQKIWLEF